MKLSTMRAIMRVIGGVLLFGVVIGLLTVLTACTPEIRTVYVTTPLTHGPRPTLPKVSEEELTCLTDAAYQKLYDRQRLITDYAVELEAIIDGTKSKNDKTNDTHLEKP